MIGLATLCLAGALGVALGGLLVERATGWRRRRIGMLVRPWVLAMLILLTIGLATETTGGIATLTTVGWMVAGAWLAVSLLAHFVGRGATMANPARRWGARVAHGGIAVAVGGILVSSMLASTTQRAMATGESIRFNGWEVQLREVWPAAGAGWVGLSAELRASGGNGVVVLEPLQLQRSGLQVSEPVRLRDDGGLLTASIAPRDAEGRWPITLGWTPLLVAIPIGLTIAVLGLITLMVGPAVMRQFRLRQARLSDAWWA